MLRTRRTPAVLLTLALAAGGVALAGGTASAHPGAGWGQRYTEKTATAYGSGGAVSSVDPEATEAGLKVLRAGGTAADAAVATAAALGVTEPYSAGVGGGGYFVYYDAKTKKLSTLDGRETTPAGMPTTAFLDPATGQPYPFATLVTSGVSVGVPGTPATWQKALQKWGRFPLAVNLAPAIGIASRGFVVDPTFRLQTLENKTRFQTFPSTAKLYLPGGDAPQVGSVFRNPDLAKTYLLMALKGANAIYTGKVAQDIATAVQNPPTAPGVSVLKGYLTTADLAAYRAIDRAPTKVDYRGYAVYGMAPSSSGGTTVGEALNILENFPMGSLSPAQYLHDYLEASALAFADRNAYVGDPAYVDVPQQTLLSQSFADSRACRIDPAKAATKPVPAGALSGQACATTGAQAPSTQGTSTTHLVATDRWGNVASYTLTIEQTGGNGLVVPGRGFLLNNELTDFNAAPAVPDDPNLLEPGKRPRSSMSPTIVLKNGVPVLAVGSPGGSTIITTVLQTLVNWIDRKMPLLQAVAAPRASQRNTASVTAEQAFITAYGPQLTPYGHTFTVAGAPGTSAADIGAVAAIQLLPGGKALAVAEPTRRGGGDAGVVRPAKGS